MRQPFDLLRQSVPGERLQGCDDLRMQCAPSLLQEAAIGDPQRAYTALTLGANRTVEWQCNEERPGGLRLGDCRLPFGELCRAERRLDALVGGMRPGAGIGGQLR